MKNETFGFSLLILVNLFVIVIGIYDFLEFYNNQHYLLIFLGILIFIYKKLTDPQINFTGGYKIFVTISDLCYSMILVAILKFIIRFGYKLII